MHFFTVLFTALSAGALALPAPDAVTGGDLSSALNTSPHDAAIGTFSHSDCSDKETQSPLSFPAAGCYGFSSTLDTVGINWGSDPNCGLNVYTDANCADFATKTLTGSPYGFTCLSMRANGGPWLSLAPAECHADAITD